MAVEQSLSRFRADLENSTNNTTRASQESPMTLATQGLDKSLAQQEIAAGASRQPSSDNVVNQYDNYVSERAEKAGDDLNVNWNEVQQGASHSMEVAKGAAEQFGKLLVGLGKFAVDPKARQDMIDGVVKTAGAIKEIGGQALAAVPWEKLGESLTKAETYQHAFSAVKNFVTDPNSWKAAWSFVTNATEAIGINDVIGGLYSVGKGIFTGDLDSIKKGISLVTNGVKTFALEATGLADLGRALQAFSKGDMLGAAMYFGFAMMDIGGLFTFGALTAGALGIKAVVKEGAKEGVESLIKEFRDKGLSEGMKSFGEYASKQLAPEVAERIQKEFGAEGQDKVRDEMLKRFLNDRSAQIARESGEELQELFTDNGIKDLQSAASKEQAAVLAKANNKILKEMPKEAIVDNVATAAEKKLLDAIRPSGLIQKMADGYEQMLREISKESVDTIQSKLQAQGIDSIRAKQVAKQLKEVVGKPKEFGKFDDKLAGLIEELSYKEIRDELNKRGVKSGFDEGVDEAVEALGKKYGFDKEGRELLAKSIREGLDEGLERASRKVAREAAEEALQRFRKRDRPDGPRDHESQNNRDENSTLNIKNLKSDDLKKKTQAEEEAMERAKGGRRKLEEELGSADMSSSVVKRVSRTMASQTTQAGASKVFGQQESAEEVVEIKQLNVSLDPSVRQITEQSGLE